MERIESPSNPRIKSLVRLRTKPAERRKAGRFLVETPRELSRALRAGFEPVDLYVCEPMVGDEPAVREAVEAGAKPIEVGRRVIEKAAYREHPTGLIAVLNERRGGWDRLDAHAGPLVVAAGIEKPGNLGAILRSADAAGAAGLLVDAPDFDLFNPNCIRASTGAVFTVPTVCDAPERLVDKLRRRGARLVTVTPDAPEAYTAATLTGPCAIAVGGEAAGLPTVWRDAADQTVSIPMRGTADSLNVSVTAALVLYESLRQREPDGGKPTF